MKTLVKVRVTYRRTEGGLLVASSPDDAGFMAANRSLARLQASIPGILNALRTARGQEEAKFEIEYREAST
jgi:hypothetical protein